MAGSRTTRRTQRVTVLAGGVGAARLLRGLHRLVDPRHLTVIVNTGDDETFFGLHVSPDVDTVLYTMAGVACPVRGWGVRGDRFRCLTALGRYYDATWFGLGDTDLATHIFRTDALRRGRSLTTVTRAIAHRLGVHATVLPMSDDPVRTYVEVPGKGILPFQQYLVRDRGEGAVRRITLRGARAARPAPGTLAAVRTAAYVIVPPSNPFVSIDPILALPGMRRAVQQTRARIAAVSPIVGGAPIKGPLHRMLAGLGHDVSPVAIARLYRDFVDVFVMDRRDARFASDVAALGMHPVVTETLMTSPARSRRLAAEILAALGARDQ